MDDPATQHRVMSHQLGGSVHIPAQQRIAHFGRTDLDGFYVEPRDFDHFIAELPRVPAQVVEVALPAHPEAVVKPDSDVFGVETAYQEFFDILLGTELGKLYRERDHYQMPQPEGLDQLDFFLKGVDERYVSLPGIDNLSRVGVERDQHAFPTNALRKTHYLGNNFLMPLVDAIEGAYRDDRVAEQR